MTDAQHDYKHLYEVPIEELGLSDEAINSLKRTGMTTIGDCIDFYNRIKDALIPMRPPFGSVMANEVAQKIKAYGYWIYVNDASQT
jgi:DNA-directed RNA polymerase subunit alpha